LHKKELFEYIRDKSKEKNEMFMETIHELKKDRSNKDPEKRAKLLKEIDDLEIRHHLFEDFLNHFELDHFSKVPEVINSMEEFKEFNIIIRKKAEKYKFDKDLDMFLSYLIKDALEKFSMHLRKKELNKF
jgi:hypothetical protein